MGDERNKRYRLLIVVVESEYAEELTENVDNYYFVRSDMSFEQASFWMEQIGNDATDEVENN